MATARLPGRYSWRDIVIMDTNWEAHYQAGETGWDKGAPSPGLLAFLKEMPLQGRILVPGCGRGHDVRALAGAGADEVVGMDIAPSAIRDASAIEHPRTRYHLGDFFEMPPEFRRGFDGVFEHTCFCAISRELRDAYVEAVAQALRPGGLFLAIFYLNPRDDEDPSLGPPFNATLEELDLRFGRDFTLLRSEIPAVAYPGREGREVLRLYRRSGILKSGADTRDSV